MVRSSNISRGLALACGCLLIFCWFQRRGSPQEPSLPDPELEVHVKGPKGEPMVGTTFDLYFMTGDPTFDWRGDEQSFRALPGEGGTWRIGLSTTVREYLTTGRPRDARVFLTVVSRELGEVHVALTPGMSRRVSVSFQPLVDIEVRTEGVGASWTPGSVAVEIQKPFGYPRLAWKRKPVLLDQRNCARLGPVQPGVHRIVVWTRIQDSEDWELNPILVIPVTIGPGSSEFRIKLPIVQDLIVEAAGITPGEPVCLRLSGDREECWSNTASVDHNHRVRFVRVPPGVYLLSLAQELEHAMEIPDLLTCR